jgi:hypothetical protein
MEDEFRHVKVDNNTGRDITLAHRKLPDGEESTLTMDEYNDYERTLTKLSEEDDFEIEVLDYKKTA